MPGIAGPTRRWKKPAIGSDCDLDIEETDQRRVNATGRAGRQAIVSHMYAHQHMGGRKWKATTCEREGVCVQQLGVHWRAYKSIPAKGECRSRGALHADGNFHAQRCECETINKREMPGFAQGLDEVSRRKGRAVASRSLCNNEEDSGSSYELQRPSPGGLRATNPGGFH